MLSISLQTLLTLTLRNGRYLLPASLAALHGTLPSSGSVVAVCIFGWFTVCCATYQLSCVPDACPFVSFVSSAIRMAFYVSSAYRLRFGLRQF